MEVEIPEFLDVMALPGATLFPGAMLPLYIFEPRYREMVARALDSHRMFAIGHLQSNDDAVFPMGGAGLLRACVANADGTSHLILQGMARVRFIDWTEAHTCREAKVEVLASYNSDHDAADTLKEEICTLCERLGTKDKELHRVLETFNDQNHDLAEFSDLISSTAVRNVSARQRLMEEPDVAKRLEIIATYLTRLTTET